MTTSARPPGDDGEAESPPAAPADAAPEAEAEAEADTVTVTSTPPPRDPELESDSVTTPFVPPSLHEVDTAPRRRQSAPPPAASPAPDASPPSATTGEPADGDPGASTSLPGIVADDEFDPAALAAAALRRLRQRAATDIAEFRTQYQKLDGLVIVLAVAIVIGAAWLHARWLRPAMVPMSEHGLSLSRASTWLPPEPMSAPAPRLLAAPTTSPAVSGELPYRVAMASSVDSSARLEILVDELPLWSNLVTGLEFDRRTRWGELYTTEATSVRAIAGHDWLRTRYTYAYAWAKGDPPTVGTAIEYATVDRDQLYVVTLRGDGRTLAELEATTVPTLRVATRSGLPLLPRVGSVTATSIAGAFPGTVMVVVADMVDGRLRARGGGSGTVVGADGSILTNFHVLHHEGGRLHDVFVIGRFVSLAKPPELVCAGRPSRAKLQRDVDLALIKCDLDLDGRAFAASDMRWPALTPRASEQLGQAKRLWVLGYPDVGGGALTASQGVVEGMTSDAGGIGTDFIKTDATITHGNSGGPVVDDAGNLVGIATGFQVRVDVSGGAVELSKPGLVRPIAAAAKLMAWASSGWVPCEGCSDVSLQPSDIEAAAEGAMLSTTIRNADNDEPVMGATLLVLRAGVSVDSVDMNRLGDSVIASGQSNADGEVHLRQPVPVPGAYGVLVIAPGYRTLASDSALSLAADTPPFFDPWGGIRIKVE
jgi:S1-C subfamily serine protease